MLLTLHDPRWVDSSHGELSPSFSITLHSDLHGQATVETETDKRLSGNELSERGQSAVLSERVTSESSTVLNQALGCHVGEGSLLHEGERWLSELGGEQETRRIREGVGLRVGLKLLDD